MKLTLIGSHLCQNTLYALYKLNDKKVTVNFQDISACFSALKQLLENRESNPVYDSVKKDGKIGIPFFILEDGTETFDLDEVLKKIKEG